MTAHDIKPMYGDSRREQRVCAQVGRQGRSSRHRKPNIFIPSLYRESSTLLQRWADGPTGLFRYKFLVQGTGVNYIYTHVSNLCPRSRQPVCQVKVDECATIYRKKISGATADRCQFKKLFTIHTIDNLIAIPAVDRLPGGRTNMLVSAHNMHRTGVELRSLAELVIDTKPNTAGLVLDAATTLERRYIIERAAHRGADVENVKFGRKLKLNVDEQREARQCIEVGKTQRNEARGYNVSRAKVLQLWA